MAARVSGWFVRVRRVVTLLAVFVMACSRHGASESGPAPALAIGVTSQQPATGEGARFPAKIAALAWETRVQEQPSASSRPIGYLRAGAVVAASSEGECGGGCKGEWRAIAPEGYVCLEPNVATTNLDDPLVRALSIRPDRGQRLPYMYGLVRRPGPVYSRFPTLREAKFHEPSLERRMRKWLTAPDDSGAAFRPEYWRRGKPDPAPLAADLWQAHTTVEVPDWVPAALSCDRRSLRGCGQFPAGILTPVNHPGDSVLGDAQKHYGFALLDTAVVDGRRYGITTDLRVVPIDRLRPIEGSAFHGYRIPEDIDFPFALVRREGARAFELRDGRMKGVQKVARRAAIRLSGKQEQYEGVLYFETTDGLWLSEAYVSRVDPVKRWTKWGADGERWVDVSIRRQVLVAYEGTKAVYATLVSTGEAGVADPQTSKATIQGEFRIFAKHLTTTMSSERAGEGGPEKTGPEKTGGGGGAPPTHEGTGGGGGAPPTHETADFELQDIPYVQYFAEGYALHAAYWHDDFGIPRSHGCVNLSPEDAKWLFSWTQPEVPTGWHGVRQAGRGSVVVVHP